MDKTRKHRLLRVMICILQVIYLISSWILSLVHRKKPPSIPPIKDPLLTLNACTLARKIRQGEITSYDVVNAYVKRIKEVNPYINAVADERFAAAENEARACDGQLKAGMLDAKTLEREKPLYGVPITVKECCGLKGLSHTGCTLANKGVKASEDATVVALFRDAGAIPLCVTNTPEMCCNYDSMNLIYGRTYNSYDTRYTPGGSSGGEASLLGAGASLIGIGSDMAGSIRIPAHFNGVFGHKPTAGTIPQDGHIPLCDDETFRMLLNFGPMTRYAEDLDLALRIMTSKCDRELRLDAPVDLKRLRIYYQRGLDDTLGMLPLSAELERCVVRAADHFALLGLRTERLPIEWSSTLVEIAVAKYLSIKKPPRLLLDHNDPKLRKNPMLEIGKALIGQSHHTFATIFFDTLMQTHALFPDSMISYYNRQGESLRRKLLDLLGENEIFIMPTFRTLAVFPEVILFEFLNTAYTDIFNVFGFPAMHVPMGLNRDGLPIGVQVIAAPYQDRLCLAVARELEKAFGGWTPPPSI